MCAQCPTDHDQTLTARKAVTACSRTVRLVTSAVGALALSCTGADADIDGPNTADAEVTRWSVVESATGTVLSSGCALYQAGSGRVLIKASADTKIDETITRESVKKRQDAPIPLMSDPFWCGTASDIVRAPARGPAYEGCAQTEPDPPATLDGVELIEAMDLGNNVHIAQGYTLHLTVKHPGVLWLVFESPPCNLSSRRDELTILPN